MERISSFTFTRTPETDSEEMTIAKITIAATVELHMDGGSWPTDMNDAEKLAGWLAAANQDHDQVIKDLRPKFYITGFITERKRVFCWLPTDIYTSKYWKNGFRWMSYAWLDADGHHYETKEVITGELK